MKRINKRKINELSSKIVTANNIQILILSIPIIFLMISQIKSGKNIFEDMLDTKIILSFLLVF